MKKIIKIITVGISLLLISVVIIGCISQEKNNKQNSKLKLPIFNISGVVARWVISQSGEFNFSFPLFIENLNNELIHLHLLYLNLIDDSGKILISFIPDFNTNIESLNQINNEQFSLKSNKNITLTGNIIIYNNSVSEYCWEYLSHLKDASISGLYKFNGDLQWFNSKIDEIYIPI